MSNALAHYLTFYWVVSVLRKLFEAQLELRVKSSDRYYGASGWMNLKIIILDSFAIIPKMVLQSTASLSGLLRA